MSDNISENSSGNEDIEDLQKLYDNPDEEFAKKNYGSVESYKKMLKRKIDHIQQGLKKEATTTSAVSGVSTPFAFSRKGIGNVRAAKMMGYKLAKLKKHKNDQLKETSFIDKNGLVQHNDPNMDPNLVTYKNTIMPTNEEDDVKITTKDLDQTGDGEIGVGDAVVAARKSAGMKGKKSKFYGKIRDLINKSLKEGYSSLRFEQDENESDNTIDIQQDFSNFDSKLKNSTELIKNNLQNTLNNKLLGKKVIVRSSKGYKQPESDYKVNVSNVEIDYYYDKYIIIIVGKEENKQKMQRFFVNPGFKIKVVGKSNIKKKPISNDEKQVADDTPGNTVTSTPNIENPNSTTSDNESSSTQDVSVNDDDDQLNI